MAFNGSGLFNIDSTGQPVSANTLIESADFNALTADLAAGLSNCVTKDGQQTITANLPMAGFRHTGVGNAAARTDYAAAGQVQDGKLNWVDGGGTADAITATYSPAITALVDGQLCCVRATAANATTTPTFSPNGLTARTIVKVGGVALAIGDISGDGHELILRYDLTNTRWELINPRGASLAANTFTGIQRWAKGADVASANALTLGTDGNYFDITGTTAITSIGTLGVGTVVKLHFDAALTLTNHATDLILPGAANITTAAGDEAEFIEYATGDWRCTSYTKANGQAVVGTGAGYPMDFRLTLTSGNPVVDIGGGATTVYCTPYIGNKIALYDGSSTWNIRTSAEFSLAIGTVTAGLPYDVFCYDNAGTPTLEKLAWASNTARATGITRQDGVYVKSGATTRRYLGTFACYNTTQSADSVTYRLLWNYYNRRPRAMSVVDTTNSWTYTTPTWRQANAASTNVLNIVTGVAEDMASISVMCQANNTTGAAASVGVGINVTNANSAQIYGGTLANNWNNLSCHYRGVLPIGLCAVNWLEISAASGTSTWYGDNNLTYSQSGIYAEIMS